MTLLGFFLKEKCPKLKKETILNWVLPLKWERKAIGKKRGKAAINHIGKST